MRKNIVAGNWKMNGTLQEGIKLAEAISSGLKDAGSAGTGVIVCPPFTHIAAVSEVMNKLDIAVGAQNCSDRVSGAFTGEVSPAMLKSAGAEYVIIGHSERRSYYGENDQLLNAKIHNALGSGLKVIFCCGEKLDERQGGSHFTVVSEQLEKGLEGISDEQFGSIIIAYEPVWAIGTGLTATSEQAQEMHAHIRSLISGRLGSRLAESTTILYGGSCNPGNSTELFSMEDVDGGLIGGASLKANDFIAIVNSF